MPTKLDDKPSKRREIEELIFIKFPHVAAGVLFLIACALNITNVVARYIFFRPIFWAEEMLTFIVIWTVFIVAGSVTYRGAHLNMDLIYSHMNAFWKRIVNTAVLACLIACSLFTVTRSLEVVALHLKTHGVTAGTDIPLWIPHSALVFGFSFIAVAAIVRWRAYITGKFD